MKTALFLATFLSATSAYAHGPSSGPNGGPQVDAGDFHIEAVVQGTTLAVYVRDAGDKPVPTDGFKGTAIFVVDGKPQRIALAPGGENRLTGNATASLAAPKGAIQISTADGKSIQGKFE